MTRERGPAAGQSEGCETSRGRGQRLAGAVVREVGHVVGDQRSVCLQPGLGLAEGGASQNAPHTGP